MDYLIATGKTLIWLAFVAVVATATVFFEIYGIPFIVDNFRIIVAIVASSIVVFLAGCVFLGNLAKVREKRKSTRHLSTDMLQDTYKQI